LICFFLAGVGFLHSQTAQRIEDLLGSEALRNDQAAWLVLEAAEVPHPVGSPYLTAFRYAAAQGWFPKGAQPNGEIRLNQASLLIMKAFRIKGGIFYTITNSPHYAYRELEYQGILQGRVDPRMAVSGDLLLYMVNLILSYREDNWL
jgi:hypothetical protein